MAVCVVHGKFKLQKNGPLEGRGVVKGILEFARAELLFIFIR